MQPELITNRRILLIDDNPAIHEDFRKALIPQGAAPTIALLDLESQLFGDSRPAAREPEATFELASAMQGADGVHALRNAAVEGRPFALAFVDIRMPPGWDGVETIERLWEIDPDLQVVLCSAYSDYSGSDVRRRLGENDGLLILKKPFDTTEVAQLAHAMTRKWSLQRAQRDRSEKLDALVRSRTRELEESNRQLAAEMSHRERIEGELRLSQKLESIGQLAAGIAHEINTPVQYVSDNIDFLRASYDDLEILRQKLRAACAHRDATREHRIAIEEIERMECDIDLDYIRENVPRALSSAQAGLERIRTIVQAMRVFGRHDGGGYTETDLNSILQSTIDVSHREYCNVADMQVELGALPPVTCCSGEIGQVFLSLIINAAHAIEPCAHQTGTKGTIRLRTALEDGDVVISIEDSGCGISEELQRRIFDPFFTTKEVGRGTGQGLSIARSIVDRHRGRLSVKSVVGEGSTFTVRLPVG